MFEMECGRERSYLSGTVVVRAVDEYTGRPLRGLKIGIASELNAARGMDRRAKIGVTGRDGSVRMHIPLGRVCVAASLSTYAIEWLGQNEELDVTLRCSRKDLKQRRASA